MAYQSFRRYEDATITICSRGSLIYLHLTLELVGCRRMNDAGPARLLAVYGGTTFLVYLETDGFTKVSRALRGQTSKRCRDALIPGMASSFGFSMPFCAILLRLVEELVPHRLVQLCPESSSSGINQLWNTSGMNREVTYYHDQVMNSPKFLISSFFKILMKDVDLS